MVTASDLAELYECKNGTKTINQAVKRHINRFSERFMFQLTEVEYDYLRSQIGTAKYSVMSSTLPYAFTEQGVAMLATILRTPVAKEVSIRIMDAFVAMRKYISNDLIEHSKMLINHENRLALLENVFDSFKDLGKKCFAITKIESKELLNSLLDKGNVNTFFLFVYIFFVK